MDIDFSYQIDKWLPDYKAPLKIPMFKKDIHTIKNKIIDTIEMNDSRMVHFRLDFGIDSYQYYMVDAIENTTIEYLLHRDDGPAVSNGDECVFYYIGERVNVDQWLKLIQSHHYRNTYRTNITPEDAFLLKLKYGGTK